MRRLLPVLLLACTGDPGAPAVDAPEGPTLLQRWCPAGDVEAQVDDALAQMSLDEKTDQLAGAASSPAGAGWRTPGVSRLGVPGLAMTDGPRGVAGYVGTATAFPVGMARGASWDPDLERRIGEAMGRETAAFGANVLLAPTMNILRHPRWGRAQETYGEDPHHMGVIATAFVQGVQSQGVMASAKHFAANSIEDTRFEVDVTADERTLREIYLPHFRRVVQEGLVGSVMSAYNKVNGDWCSESVFLLTQVLKEEWGFPGFVESDWAFGTHSTVAALEAGLDLEMPAPIWFGDRTRDAVIAGELDESVVDEAVRRLVRAQLCYGLEDPAPASRDAVESSEHLALAREAAARSAVLLRNDGTLPLDAGANIALLGPLADAENIGDTGSSAVQPSEIVTIAEGLDAALGPANVLRLGPPPWGPEDQALLDTVDAAVAVVGLTSSDEGESLLGAGDRDDYDLPATQVALLEELAAHTDRVVVVLEGGSAIGTTGWIDTADALLMAWYPGSQGGHGIADVLLGVTDASGRLPFAWAATDADLPTFDNVSTAVTYDRWHGYRHLDREGIAAAFPFGAGLSYATWETAEPTLSADTATSGDTVQVSLRVDNTGDRAGRHTVQLYATAPEAEPEAPAKVLRGFAQVDLEAGASEVVTLDLPVDELAHWEDAWRVTPGAWTLRLGTDADTLPHTLTLTVEP